MANRASEIRMALAARYPGAVLVERGPSHLRHQLPDLDGRKRFAVDAVIGAIHYKDDKGEWQEIDDALEDDGTEGFSVRTAGTGHLFRMAADGKRRLYPNRYDLTRYVEFSGLPSPGIPQRGGNYLAWDRLHFAAKISNTADGIKFLFTLKDASAPTSVSFNVSLVGLTRQGRFLLADGVPVAEMRLPTAIDAAGTERDCSFTLTAGKVTISLDTTGLVFPIEIDPTVDVQVGANADDGFRFAASSFNATLGYMNCGYSASGNLAQHAFARWTAVTLAGEITESYIEVYPYEAAVGTPLRTISAVDADNPTAPTNAATFDAKPLTTYSVDWDGALAISGWRQSGSLNTIFQELVDSAYPITNDAVIIYIKDRAGTGENYQLLRTYATAGYGPKLHVVYSAGVIQEGSATLTGAGATTVVGRRLAGGKVETTGSGAVSFMGAFDAGFSAGFLTQAGGHLIAGGRAVLSGSGLVVAAGGRKTMAAAALSGSGALSTVARRVLHSETVLSGSGLVAATGLRVRRAAAAISGSGGLVASVVRWIYGSASLAANGGLTAIPRARRAGSTSLSATGYLSAAAGEVAIKEGRAELSGMGNLQAAARPIRTGIVSSSGTGTTSVIGHRLVFCKTAIAAAGNVVAVGHRLVFCKAAVSGSGLVATTGRCLRSTTVLASGNGTLAAAAVRHVYAKAALSAAGTVATNSRVLAAGSSLLSGTSYLSAAAGETAVKEGRAELFGNGAISCAALSVRMGNIAVSANGNLLAAGALLCWAKAVVSASGTVVVIGSLGAIEEASTVLSGSGTVVVLGTRMGCGKAVLSGNGVLAATAAVEAAVEGSALLVGEGNVLGVARVLRYATASFTGLGQLAASGSYGVGAASAVLSGMGYLTLTLGGAATVIEIPASYEKTMHIRASYEPLIEVEAS